MLRLVKEPATQCWSAVRYAAKRTQDGLSGPSGYSFEPFVGCGPNDDNKQATTLVDIRMLNLADAGSIPAISTKKQQHLAAVLLFNVIRLNNMHK